MTTQLISFGGVQSAVIFPQIIYLDFDGELTRCNGELLTVDNVTVEDSGLTGERIAQITQALNDRFSRQNVEFVTVKPASGDYSTIYIGKTSAFASYGSFAGLAETVDSGNKVHNDNAFVMLDSLSSNDRIADVIAHEAGHLLGTLDHGGEGLARYAQTSHTVSSGVTSTGVVLSNYDIMQVCCGGAAVSTTLSGPSFLNVDYGGTATGTTIGSGGHLNVSDGGSADGVVIQSGILSVAGKVTGIKSAPFSFNLYCSSGGYMAFDSSVKGCYLGSGTNCTSRAVTSAMWYPAVDSGNSLFVLNGAYAQQLRCAGNGKTYVAGGNIVSGYLRGEIAVHTEIGSIVPAGWAECKTPEMHLFNGYAEDTAVSGGNLYIHSGGTASNIHFASVTQQYEVSEPVMDPYAGFTDPMAYYDPATGLYYTLRTTSADIPGSAAIYSGGTLLWAYVSSGGWIDVKSGGLLNSFDVRCGGQIFVSSGGTVTGLGLCSGGTVTGLNGTLDFDLRRYNAVHKVLYSDYSVFSGSFQYTLTVSSTQAEGTYALADKVTDFSKTFTVKTLENTVLGALSVGNDLIHDGKAYSLSVSNSVLTLTIDRAPEAEPYNLSGNSSGLSWNGNSSSGYVGEISFDSFEHAFVFSTAKTKIDTCGLPAGICSWNVRNYDSENKTAGNPFTVEKTVVPESFVSVENGISDIFFAAGKAVWKSGYAAEHVGCGSWSGTGEQVDLAGKNQITDVFEGSSDANILVMTDDTNGDALFADDIYSAFPDEQQSRIAQIDEIRAGAGDDIVDMTSRRFTYSGDSLIIRGGDGSDTIWANSGNNKLFGDAGDDRIAGASGNDVFAGGSGNDSLHGGGGDDIFCFCKGWGTDTVEQLSGGSVTLWFVSGNDECWDQKTMTYIWGANSVKVTGVTDVSLKFGDDGSELYDTLLAQGCFISESSEKIFEENGKGVIVKI